MFHIVWYGDIDVHVHAAAFQNHPVAEGSGTIEGDDVDGIHWHH